MRSRYRPWPRLAPWCALLLAGCADRRAERYVPAPDAAREALEVALQAWQGGSPPGKVERPGAGVFSITVSSGLDREAARRARPRGEPPVNWTLPRVRSAAPLAAAVLAHQAGEVAQPRRPQRQPAGRAGRGGDPRGGPAPPPAGGAR